MSFQENNYTSNHDEWNFLEDELLENFVFSSPVRQISGKLTIDMVCLGGRLMFWQSALRQSKKRNRRKEKNINEKIMKNWKILKTK